MKNKLAKPVLQFDMEDNVIREYESQSDAAKAINGCQARIASCMRGKADSYKNYKWKYKYE